MAATVVLAPALSVGFLAAPLKAQSATRQAPATQTPTQSSTAPSPVAQPSAAQSQKMGDWQTAAGGKMEFDVASVKQNTAAPSAQTVHSNIPLGPQDLFTPTGGLLSSTNWLLFQYLVFAYKLTADQTKAVISQLPKWATTDRYDIEARASGNPTKDQFRLMMQALLADRFKLAIHFETKQLPIFALVLNKPGKFGPQFRQHPVDAPCSNAPPPPNTTPGQVPTVAGGFPEPCGAFQVWRADTPGHLHAGGRNMPMAMIATSFGFSPLTGVDRPILDKTELTGGFDFIMEFAPQINGPLPPGVDFQADPTGPTFLEALKEQLGLKLDSQTGPVDLIVVDHVEQPSEN
jgi:uncharacterized protein (TIGR03435 family)